MTHISLVLLKQILPTEPLSATPLLHIAKLFLVVKKKKQRDNNVQSYVNNEKSKHLLINGDLKNDNKLCDS
jgi:hypothetical protein